MSTGTSWGERSGAPAPERFPTFPHRGDPGGTVGTMTGRPQGLNPAQMQGVALAGRRERNRRGGRSVSALSFRGVTARHSPGARHPLMRQEARRAEGRTGKQEMLITRCHRRAGTNSRSSSRSLPPACSVPGAQASVGAAMTYAPPVLPGCPPFAGMNGMCGNVTPSIRSRLYNRLDPARVLRLPAARLFETGWN